MVLYLSHLMAIFLLEKINVRTILYGQFIIDTIIQISLYAKEERLSK